MEMDTDSWNKAVIYADIAKYIEPKFDTSNYKVKMQLLQVKNKNMIGLIKNQLGRHFMINFVGLRQKILAILLG